jgi:hypothetical protein
MHGTLSEWNNTVTVASINQEATAAGLSANAQHRLNCASSTMNDCRVSRSNPMYPMSSHVCRPRALVSAPERREACAEYTPGAGSTYAPEYACAGVCAPGAGVCTRRGLRRYTARERRMSSAAPREYARVGSTHAPEYARRRRVYAPDSMYAPEYARQAPKYEHRAGYCDAPGVGEYAPGVCTRQRCIARRRRYACAGVCMRRRRGMSGVCRSMHAPGRRAGSPRYAAVDEDESETGVRQWTKPYLQQLRFVNSISKHCQYSHCMYSFWRMLLLDLSHFCEQVPTMEEHCHLPLLSKGVSVL